MNTKEGATQLTVVTVLYDTLANGPDLVVWSNHTGTVNRTIPPSYPKSQPNALCILNCNDFINRTKRRPQRGFPIQHHYMYHSVPSTATVHSTQMVYTLQLTEAERH